LDVIFYRGAASNDLLFLHRCSRGFKELLARLRIRIDKNNPLTLGGLARGVAGTRNLVALLKNHPGPASLGNLSGTVS